MKRFLKTKIFEGSSKEYSVLIHLFSVFIIFSIFYTLFFSPVFFSKGLLAPADGIVQSVPAFYTPRTLWTNLLLSGFPALADPTVQSCYPLSLILSVIPGSWNSFVISAYVLSSCFSYGYVYTITRSRLAASVSGIIYGMSGFMMAHLGHTTMIHTAVWMPLIIWALEKLRHNFDVRWFAIGVGAVAFSVFAGHPQIFVYSTGLSAVYALIMGWSASIGKWKYYKIFLGFLVLGVALAAIQLIPTIELSKLSARSEMTFEEFITYSLPLNQIIQLIFPYLFGHYYPNWLYKLPYYFGEWNLTEITGYIGLLPILLAAIGFLSYRHKRISLFWFFAGLLALLLTFGGATPLANLMYHIPAYNKFRVPARHFIEVALAVSVLAGLGIAAIQQQMASKRFLLKVISASAGLMLISALSIFVFSNQIRAKLINAGAEKINLFFWFNPSIGVPLVVFASASVVLIYWSRSITSKPRIILLLLILVIDLGSFGWFYEWQYAAPSQNLLTPTAATQKYKEILNTNQQRMLPIRGGVASLDEIPPNMSRLWGVPSASGYGPLILSRVSVLFPMGPAGDIWGAEDPAKLLSKPSDRALDIMSIRYLFTPAKPSTTTENQGVSWNSEDLPISLGSGCAIKYPNSVKFNVPAQQTATAIGIVSSLACSYDISNNAEVLRVRLTDNKGSVTTQNLLAGRDTSEWAYDCSDVLPLMKHNRAPIFQSFPRDASPKCDGYRYVSILPLDKLSNVKNVELEWLGKSGAINIQKISLINDKNQHYPAKVSDFIAEHWLHIEDINQTSVYENLKAMPRAWLVPEVVRGNREEVLHAIKHSQLPDGRSYNPSQVALVEEKFNFKTKNVDLSATAKVVNLSDTQVVVQTSSSSPSFLVLSDIYYPGWKVSIDGKPSHIYKTNFVLRGVQVPVGTHTVKFEFKPMSFNLGAGISTASLVLLGYLYFKFQQKQKLLLNE